jgi:hypothetical protein
MSFVEFFHRLTRPEQDRILEALYAVLRSPHSFIVEDNIQAARNLIGELGLDLETYT